MGDFKEDILKGKTALVTGGGTGIGKEIARTLGRHGANIIITSRKQTTIEQTSREFQDEGIDCLSLPSDVRDPVQVEQVIHGGLSQFGSLDIVVNNAAANFPAQIKDISYNGFKTIVDIDLLGTYNVTKAAFEGFLKDHGGAIVNITGPVQHWGVAYQAHVAAAKNGIESLTRTCAVEWIDYGIRVNSVAPGAISDTPGLKLVDAALGDTKKRRLGTKQDMANAVLFLVSDSAAYINGINIRVDGGASIDIMKVLV